MKEHGFTIEIKKILQHHFAEFAEDIFNFSELLQYLNLKTISASRGSKARGAFGNLYAIYVLVEDYVRKGYAESGNYEDYEGAKFSDLMNRQRQLPFGGKLQNHALNHRLNQEFKKFFPTSDFQPILRDASTNRYWFNENLLLLTIANHKFNVANAVLDIIDAYVIARQESFRAFVLDCKRMERIQEKNPDEVIAFISKLLRPNVDARIFEIVSFAILKAYYSGVSFFWGWTEDSITEDKLSLYKTGRTNANDGGIDFVMRPVGRFYQVTETLDVRKYFLDIDKVQKYPMTFVVKSEMDIKDILTDIRDQARRQYKIQTIIDRHMDAIEEIINIPRLMDFLRSVSQDGDLTIVLEEIVTYSRLEFNFSETTVQEALQE